MRLLVCAFALSGCTQDFGVFTGAPVDASTEGGDSATTADGQTDAGTPDGSMCVVDPQCLNAAKGCAVNCVNTSTLCQTQCDMDQTCITQCKATETACRQPCEQSCITCATGAPCDVTAACKSASGL